MRIYDEYTSKIRSASHTNSLKKFTEKLCAKMGVVGIGGKAEDRRKVLGIIKANDLEVLEILREETQLVVLMMREVIEDRKARGENEFELIDAHIQKLMEGPSEKL